MAGQSNLWSYNDLHERCFTENEGEGARYVWVEWWGEIYREEK